MARKEIKMHQDARLAVGLFVIIIAVVFLMYVFGSPIPVE